MTDLIEVVASWPTLLSVLLIFGFAPGFLLRLLVMIYPREDPRRRELVAELYALRRLERPLFVAEQLETVLFEGVPGRARAALRGLRMLTRKRPSRLRVLQVSATTMLRLGEVLRGLAREQRSRK